MSLTTTEEALVRELLAQQAAILSLAENEATIQSKLGATKVTLSDLTAASSLGDTDLLLVRQGTTDKSISGAIVKTTPDASITVPKLASDVTSLFGQSSTSLDQSALLSGAATTLDAPEMLVTINGTRYKIPATTIDITASASWDVSSFATAANRAGKDFYLYALSTGAYILSNASTFPAGYTALNSRKVGGFHCLCVAVGTIAGHTLSGYAQGSILPRSVWDHYNKSSAAQEGTVKSLDGNWVDIYLPSVSSGKLVSVFGGTIADGGNGWHNYKFEQKFGEIGKKLIRQTEFVVASLGSNQGTNISGSADPGTTGGHVDTAGRRMISNIGCEDMCGALWQWCRDVGGTYGTGAAWVNAYDANDSGVAGQHYAAPYRGLLGGGWSNGVNCGSRGSHWDGSPLALGSDSSGRGVAEPARNRF